MVETYSSTLKTALALSKAERVQLVDALIASLEPENATPLDDAWLAEIDRRSTEFDSGQVVPVPWAQVREQARQRLNRRG